MKTNQEALTELRRRSSQLQKPISAADNFVIRIVKALDISFERLAEICEIEYLDVFELVAASRTDLSKFDTDPLWNKLHEYVLVHLGNIMAVKIELDAKMQQDRRERVAQRMRQETHR